MAYSSQSVRRGALFVGAAAVVGLLTACGTGEDATAEPVRTVGGTAAPASGDVGRPTSPGVARPSGDSSSAAPRTAAPAITSTGTGTGGGTEAAGTRCHTSELRASVGRNDPGAGQENFPLVLTNRSARTCTLRGYPGAAFVNGSGTRLGPDPRRSTGSPVTVILKPGQSAWAGLTFSNPEISGAGTARPAALLITPPDERDHLTVAWTAGAVPVSGNASSVSLTVFTPGSGG